MGWARDECSLKRVTSLALVSMIRKTQNRDRMKELRFPLTSADKRVVTLIFHNARTSVCLKCRCALVKYEAKSNRKSNQSEIIPKQM